MYRRTITAVGVTATTVLATALTGMGSAVAAPSSASAKAVPNSKPSWVAHTHRLGHAGQHAGVHARVYLAPRGGTVALQQAASAISTPGSASYHKFLTAAQYHQRFDATATSVHAVTSFLRKSGLKVTGTAAHNRYVTVSGTVTQAEHAFGAKIGRYHHAGRTVQAPESALKVPAGVSSSVLAVSGLDTTPAKVTPTSKQDAPPPAGFRNARPCSTAYGDLAATYQQDYKTKLPKFQGKTLPYAVCGYTGPQFRAAYEGGTALDGTGATVGIIDAYAAPTIVKDTTTYANNHADAPYAKGQYTQTVPKSFTHAAPDDCDASGWYGEQTLDVEAVHAMAQGAKIHYYGSKSCYDLGDTLQQVVDDNKVDIVTDSFGDAGEVGISSADIAAENNTFMQAATQGISFLFSSGDEGDEAADIGYKSADFEASDPYVTAVGGTATAIAAKEAPDGSVQYYRKFDTGWGTDKYSLSSDGKSWTANGYLYGAGGGTSTLFNQPSYQAGITPDGGRQVPDVAMDADPTTGMLVGETQTFSTGVQYDEYRIGGTSLASPLFAGMTALAVQHAGKRAGFLNPTIYKKRATAFTDVKGTPPDAGNVRVDYANTENGKDGYVYSIRTFNQDSSLQVKQGWDNVTGVGVPNTKWFSTLG
ncbi:protease pro-enzyme activation domain-containing protein [uncultured Jatrophihabitans sp.]|uniref:S53 family peptidase n=1 Tax=uncultured Jatrophihabitans sp. TaxID=1610747 RepID=UPI0035CC7B30